MRFDVIIKTIAAFFGGVIGFVTGQWTGVLTCLIIMQAVDYFTGWVCAALGKSAKTDNGRLSSAVGWSGLARKGFVWLLIVVTWCVDKYVIGSGSACMTASALFYVANEALSILENCALIGLPVPAFLRKLLEVLREKNDKAVIGEEKPKEDTATE